MRASVLALVVVGVVGCGDDGGHVDPNLDTTIDSQPPALTNNPVATLTFHSVPEGTDFVCQLDGGGQSPCTSPYTITVADGVHAFLVSTLGARATIDPTPASASWTVDTMAPDTAITAMPAAIDNSIAPAFAFTSPDLTATFECALDGAAFAACTTPNTLAVADGSHTFAVRAKDAATNVDPSPATYTWLVDTSTPDTAIDSGPAAGATSGPSASFAFSSPNTADATFECALDGAALAACTSPLALGPLADGAHTITVRAKDVHGVVDPTPATRTWTVDATPPDVTITSHPTDPSNDTTPTFGFTSTDATATFECQIPTAGGFVACTSLWDGPTILAGPQTFDVRATDAYGNVSAPATFAWVVDLTPPTVTITSGPTGPTKVAAPTFGFTTAGSPVTIECELDAGAFAACTSPFAPGTLADGAHSITVRATDAAGNTGSASRSFSVDTTPPVVTFTAVPASPSNDNTPTWAFTTDTPGATLQCQGDTNPKVSCISPNTAPALADGMHTLTVFATDAVGNVGSAASTITIDTAPPVVSITSGPAGLTNNNAPSFGFTTTGSPTTIQCELDTGAFAACTSPFAPGTLADGAHSITVHATDAAGNTGSAARAFTVDTTPPVVTFTALPTSPTNDNTPTWSFTSEAGATFQCKVDTGALAACTSPFTATTLADGAHTLTVVATDTAGNTGSATSTIAIDTTAPVVTFTLVPTSPTSDNTPSWSFTSDTTGATFKCKVDTGAQAACTSPFTATTLADAAHTLTVFATDAAGNTGSAASTITVDTTPPGVTITSGPSGLTNNNTPSFGFTTTGSPTTIQCELDTGAFAACTSPFAPGTLGDGAHSITVHATDAAGNTGAGTRSFTVDTTPPIVTFTLVPTSPTNDKTPSWSFTSEAGATFQCQVDTGAQAACTSPFTSTALADGSHTLTVFATDTAGNVGNAASTIAIDTTAPVVAFTGGPANPTPTNDNTPTFTFTTTGGPFASVTCAVDGGAAASCTTNTFTTAALGDGGHTLVVTATDLAGNAGAASRAFTIDTTAPTVTFDDVPPAQWPVNYYDIQWHASETATFQCSLNGAALAPCTSPFSVTATYDISNKFTVQATDAVGNAGAATTSWTPSQGLVLHYAFEQGSLKNTSLLAQRTQYSPTGSTAGALTPIGGWAGTSLNAPPAITINGTKRALLSSADSTYTANIWVRATPNANGTLWSNLDATAGGIKVTMEGTNVVAELAPSGGGNPVTITSALNPNEWSAIGIVTTGKGKGIALFVDGRLANSTGGVFADNGFDAAQAKLVTVGPITGADVDDLRFFNYAIDDKSMCTFVARGYLDANNICHSAPGIELAFEGSFTDTGTYHLPIKPATGSTITGGLDKLGQALKLGSTSAMTESNLSQHLLTTTAHSLTFWYDTSASLSIFDITKACGLAAPATCGIRVSATSSKLILDSYNVVVTGNPPTHSIALPTTPGVHGVAIVEQKTADTTDAFDIYIDGTSVGSLTIGGYNAFANSNDVITYNKEASGMLDEIQFWERDISTTADELCENGFDGEWDPAAGKCTLTSN